MSDIIFCWEFFPRLLRIISLLLKSYFITRFLRPYLKRGVTLFASGLAYALAATVICVVPAYYMGAAAELIASAAMLAAMLFFEREKPCQKIFLSVTTYIVPWTIHSAVVIPWNTVYSAVLMNDYVLERPWLNFSLFVILDTAYYALRLFLMEVVFRVFNRFYIYKNEELSARELIIMLLPALPAAFSFWFVEYYEDIYVVEHFEYIWENRAEYQWILLLFQIVLLAAAITALYVSQSIKKARREEKEAAVLLEQTEDIRRRISRLEKLYAEVRNLRHDVRNHIFTLERLYSCGEGGQAEEYARNLIESMESLSSDIRSGNPVTDMILEEKRAAAAEMGISLECGFRFPEGSDVNAFDISVILNNALDNALENTSGGRTVSVLSRRRKNSFLIEVKNSFSGEITTGADGLPETTKKDRQNHGCGLANIRHVARKYNGELAFEAGGGSAELTVLLMPEWHSQQ